MVTKGPDKTAMPARSEYGAYWGLNPSTSFLNHGSFGACPIAVLSEQTRLRSMMESDPVEFFLTGGFGRWQESIVALSTFTHADPAGMALVTNSTTGVSTVLRSLLFESGDEIIVPDHAYQACQNAIDFVARRGHFKVVRVQLPFHMESEDEIVEAILQSLTCNSKLALIDTVSSPTGIRMPFERLIHEIQGRGVDVLLDCSHGVGLLPLDLESLDAAYATGNCHKWLCTPKGSGFLHVRSDRRHLIRPLCTSHGYSPSADDQNRFRQEFDWQGTQDITPWLCIGTAIEHVGGLMPGGWPAIMERNHQLVLRARDTVCEVLGISPPVPDSMISAMAAVELASSAKPSSQNVFERDSLMHSLLNEYGIQVQIFPWRHHDARYLRFSAALYNSEAEYVYLAEALKALV